ncbi:sensor histidine kinase [Sphaerisporangium fuscum]|uniref:sensor histidine kinase n=1 Tax=Sphaerisporangium fuscum TaxID=2835868 RepID=UPI001BDBBB4B|nr:nitrate- and nitrite sensing domain-containing protein [Sphaerisporangium fuscum]
MRNRNSRVRTKVTALIMSLVALWGFAAWVTLREGLNLLWISTLDSGVSQPAEKLISELQRERRLTSVLLGAPGPSPQQRDLLAAQRTQTLAAGAVFHRVLGDGEVRRAATDVVMRRIVAADQALQDLASLRRKVDAGQIDRYTAEGTFTDVIESFYRIYDVLAILDDQDFAKDTRTLLAMARAKELLSREDSLVAGALESGRFGRTDRVKFTQIVGAQRLFLGRASAELPERDRAAYDRLTASDPFKRFHYMEDQLIQGDQANAQASIGKNSWRIAAETVIAQLDKLIEDSGDALVQRATPLAVGVVVRLALAGGLGLLAVIASIVLSITTARSLVRRLEELKNAALELAARRLPGVVERLGRGDEVDVAAEAPPLAVGDDAIGQVGRAFNTVQETAIRVAVEQAELRRSHRLILLNLARRTQSLVHRQLTVLDAMERRETEPAELADLFRIDHLATRMRRNAENLIILSGASPGRSWRRSVPMVDVVRGALAEIEDYTQVTLMPMGEAELAGRAVGDVIHLLAELIENAVSFSPPYASVQVSGQEVAKGYVIEIEDRGLGMSPEDLAAANERIVDPPEFKPTDTPRLGLYVVSRLTSRHHIQVTLKASAYGGTTVVVLIPRELISGDLEPEADVDPANDHDAERRPPSGTTEPAQGGHAAAVLAAPTAPEAERPAGGAPSSSAAAEADPTHRNGTDAESAPPRRDGTIVETDLPRRNGSPSESDISRRKGSSLMSDLPRRTPAPTETDLPRRSTSLAETDLPKRERGTAAGDLPAPDAAPEPRLTPSGLPRRVAQANLAPELRGEPAAPGDDPSDDGPSPEEMRRLMGSFQSGTERGRSEAARMPRRLDAERPPEDPPPARPQ